MTNATVSRLGQVNTAGATDALFLKMFSGEVLTAFEQATKFLKHHWVRSISSGKSIQVPMIGRNSASYHTVGQDILGTAVAHNERIITIDDMLVSSAFIADWDDLVNHYEVRGPYSKEIAAALAKKFDRQVAQVAVLAARASSPITGENGGTVLEDPNYETSGAALAAAAFDAGQLFDESEVTGTPRMFLRPAQHALMAETTSILNKDWGGAGSFSQGSVGPVNGIEIVKTNSVPSTNVASGPTKYQGDFTDTVGVVMTDMAVGTVKLKDVAVGTQYDLSRLGTLIVGSLAVGSDILRPICSIELSKATP
jgi:hypothetical protein